MAKTKKVVYLNNALTGKRLATVECPQNYNYRNILEKAQLNPYHYQILKGMTYLPPDAVMNAQQPLRPNWEDDFDAQGKLHLQLVRVPLAVNVQWYDELLRVSTEGLSTVAKATQAADCLRAQLAMVKDTLEYVSDTVQMQFFQNSESDDLELRTARAQLEVDKLLHHQAAKDAPPLPAAAMEDLKLLQRHCQDVALLACSRFLSLTVLQSKGIQTELLARLEAAFGQAALQDDFLWGRLGNSKYHVFTPGLRFGMRNQTDATEDEASTETEDPASSSAASSSTNLPAGTTAAPAHVGSARLPFVLDD